MLGVRAGSEVLYVGDHIYGDILRSKKVRQVAAGVCGAGLMVCRVCLAVGGRARRQ
jgi:hypothetical protein